MGRRNNLVRLTEDAVKHPCCAGLSSTDFSIISLAVVFVFSSESSPESDEQCGSVLEIGPLGG